MTSTHLQTTRQAEAVSAHARGSSVQICAEAKHITRPRPEQFALINTLHLVELLQYGPLTPRILRTRLRLDQDILEHHIAEARHMGADLAKLGIGGRTFYILNNWEDCRKTVTRWLQLEQERDLRSEA